MTGDSAFVVFDRGLLQERAWWVERLAGIDERAQLRPDGRAQDGAGAWSRLDVGVPLALAARVDELTGSGPFLTYTTLFAGIAACLSRLAGRETVVVGSPSRDPGVPMDPNVLAVPVTVDGGRSFRHLLLTLRDTLLEAYGAQRYPFRRLLADLGLGDAGTSCPLFGVAARSAALHHDMPDAGHDVTVTLASHEPLLLRVDYRPGRHAPGTVQRFCDYTLHLLGDALRDPDRAVDDLALVGADEQRYLVGGWRADAPADPPEPPAVPEGANLTRNQLLVWAGQKLQPDVPLYNMVTLTWIDGALDPAAFRRAWAGVVAGTDALRTVVHAEGGLPRARTVAGFAEPLEQRDHRDDPDAAAHATDWARARLARPLDLTRRPFDAALVDLGGDRWLWYLCVHHLSTDGVSNALLQRRTADLYARAVAGEPQPEGRWPAFADVVAADRAYRSSPRAVRSEAFWRERLTPLPRPPRWFGRQPPRTHAGLERVTLRLDRDETARLRRAVDRPPYRMLNADFSLLLGLLTPLQAAVHLVGGTGDVAVGVVFHNRPEPALRDTVGLLMEVCPVRVGVSGDDTFGGLAARTADELRAVLRHARHSVGNPHGRDHYDVLLNVHSTAFGDFGGLPARSQWLHPAHGNESLSVDARVEAGGLVLDCDFHAGVFSPGERAATASHLLRLLRVACDDPGTRLADAALDGVTPPPPTVAAALPAGGTVCDLVAAQVQRRPGAAAVEAGGRTVTYAELDRSARAVAADLHARGVGASDAVAVCLPRSPELVAAVLGVLHSGAACVPLDPALPAARRRAMASAAGAAVVLGAGDVRATAATARAGAGVDGEQVALVLFTSGSTGAPKAVELRHAAVAGYTRFAVEAFELGPADRVLQFASPAVDTFCEEVFATLAAGATLVLRTEAMLGAAPTFLRACHELRVTVLDLPTAYWHELAAGCTTDDARWLEHLRLLVLGGERLAPERLRAWRAVAGTSQRILNTYGPTEATVVALTHEVAPDDGAFGEVPVGRAVDGARAYVLDARLRPAPVGVPGELYLGGGWLARGYRGDRPATAERFVPDPFSPQPGARMYRTGDRGCWLADGSIEFLGRVDDQVKIRGHRVEPGEATAALVSSDGVADAIVVAEGAPARLVAYVVPSGDAGAGWAPSLRSALLARLPDHLVPAVFVPLERLPRTPSGKVDRARLPAPAQDPAGARGDFLAPRTPGERALAAIWQEVLGTGPVGVHDNFFELGGHSLLATQVVARVLESFGVELGLRALFDHPTVAGLAEVVAQAGPPRSGSAQA